MSIRQVSGGFFAGNGGSVGVLDPGRGFGSVIGGGSNNGRVVMALSLSRGPSAPRPGTAVEPLKRTRWPLPDKASVVNPPHVGLFDTSAALETLPGMTPQAEKQPAAALKTGTDNLPVNAVAVPTHGAIPESKNRGALYGALLCTKPKRTVAPNSVNAESGTSVSNPHGLRQTRMVVGDFNQCARRESNLQPSASEADALSN